jgi:DNA-binding PadR family transcriptional regulator
MPFPHFHKLKHFARGRRGGPFGGRGFDEGGGGRQRQPRGDIKFVLLEMLSQEPHHGYELIKMLEERSGGFYRPSPGMVYPTLQLLEEEGNLTSQTVNDKKVYTITEAGKQLLAERDAEHPMGGRGHHRGQPGPGRGFGAHMPQLMELRKSSMALFESVMQAGRYGTPEQVIAVQELLKKANQEVHAILAATDKPKNF